MALKQQSLTKNLSCACLEQPVLIKAKNWVYKTSASINLIHPIKPK